LTARSSTGTASSASSASSARWRSASASPAHLRTSAALNRVEGVVVLRIVVVLLFFFLVVILVDVHFVESRCKGARLRARTWWVAWDDEVVDRVVCGAGLDSLNGFQEIHLKFDAGGELSVVEGADEVQ
jgi:hypothetical protein